MEIIENPPFDKPRVTENPKLETRNLKPEAK